MHQATVFITTTIHPVLKLPCCRQQSSSPTWPQHQADDQVQYQKIHDCQRPHLYHWDALCCLSSSILSRSSIARWSTDNWSAVFIWPPTFGKNKSTPLTLSPIRSSPSWQDYLLAIFFMFYLERIIKVIWYSKNHFQESLQACELLWKTCETIKLQRWEGFSRGISSSLFKIVSGLHSWKIGSQIDVLFDSIGTVMCQQNCSVLSRSFAPSYMVLSTLWNCWECVLS